MADAKVTALTALTGANTVPADVLLIVDVSDTTMAASGTTKSITREELGTFAGTFASTATTLNVGFWDATAPSTCSSVLYGSRSVLRTAAAAFTTTSIVHFQASTTGVGAGSTVTNSFGFYATNSIATATNNYAFYSNLASASGTWQLYMGGTASNYINGITGIGIAPSSTAALTLAVSTAGVASLRIGHGTAPSSPVNGDIWTTTAGLYVRINGSTVGPLS